MIEIKIINNKYHIKKNDWTIIFDDKEEFIQFGKSVISNWPANTLLLKEICQLLGYNTNEILSRRRTAKLVDSRITIAKILKERNYTDKQIGEIMNRDKTMISYWLDSRKRERRKLQFRSKYK